MKLLFSALILAFAFAGLVQQTSAQEGLQQQEAAQILANVRVGKQKKASRSKITVKFVSLIEDSRCPTDAQCIQAGNARIKVQVSKPGSEPVTIEMNTTFGAMGGAYDSYAINLTKLTPVPKSNVRLNRNAYTATFTIRRLSR